MSIRTDFSDSFPEQTFGRITGTFAISQFPNVPGRLARLKADPANSGIIWVGSARATGMFPMPYPFDAGYDTGWFSMTPSDTTAAQGNLNCMYMNGSSGSCYISYWIQR